MIYNIGISESTGPSRYEAGAAPCPQVQQIFQTGAHTIYSHKTSHIDQYRQKTCNSHTDMKGMNSLNLFLFYI